MPTNIRYPLDLTGINPDNLIVNEVVTLLPGTAARIYVPLYTPFFSNSMVIVDQTDNNRTLIRGVDYDLAELVEDASIRSGKEIMSLVLIKNKYVSESLLAKYQLIGGDYQQDAGVIGNLYKLVMSDERPVDWNNVLNKPTEFPPTLHKHLMEDLVGFEYVIYALERVRNAVSATDLYVIDYFMNWVNNRLLSYGDTTQGIVITDKMSYTANQVINVTVGSRDLKYPTDTLTWSIRHLQTRPDNFVADQGNFNMSINKGDFTITVSSKSLLTPLQFQIDVYDSDIGDYNFATSKILTINP